MSESDTWIDKLEHGMDAFLAALLTSPTIQEAAKQCDISERTAHRYLKEPYFVKAYREARREVVNHALCAIQATAGEAVSALRSILNDDQLPPAPRVSAARTVLEMATKAVELGDLQERLEFLERLVAKEESDIPNLKAA